VTDVQEAEDIGRTGEIKRKRERRGNGIPDPGLCWEGASKTRCKASGGKPGGKEHRDDTWGKKATYVTKNGLRAVLAAPSYPGKKTRGERHSATQ